MKLRLFALVALLPMGLFAQEESAWSHSGLTGINFSQTSFTNWSEGGENNIASNVYLNGSLNYKKDKTAWTNDLSANYGLNYTTDNGWRKNIDNLNLASKYGRQFTDKFYYAGLLDVKTQMGHGYNYGAEKTLISKFATPAYINLSVGIDYKPNDKIAIYYSPVAGKMTIVADSALVFTQRFGVDEGKYIRTQLGSTFKVNANYVLMDGKLTLKSAADFFTAYDDSFGNVDVNWDVLVGLNLTKLITLTFQSTLKYDDDVKNIKDGEVHGAKIQFKEILGLGLSYKF